MTFIFCRATDKDFSLGGLHVEMGFAIGIGPFAFRNATREETINAERNFLTLYGLA